MADNTPTTIPFFPAHWLPWLLAPLVPAERKAMAEIAESAEILDVDGETWLLVPVTSQETLDTLAAFAAEGEDCQNDLEDEEEQDDDRDSDNAVNSNWDDDRESDVDDEPDDEPEEDDHSGSNDY